MSCASTHTSCNITVHSLALPHIRDATLLHALLHFMHIHTYVMLRCCRFSCASTHTSCHAAEGGLALPHIRHATLLEVLLHFHTYLILCCCRCLALPHIRHATLLCTLWHFHTYVMQHCCTLSCTSCISTHTSCYAAVGFLPLPHICHATLL